jgi:hypothetical protein
MTRRQSVILQGLLEAAIPVYGYFAWDWDLSFILLFYFVDWLLSFGLFWAKAAKRFRFSGLSSERSLMTRTLLISVPLIAVAAALFAFAAPAVVPGMSWADRTMDFLMYEEWGIKQGYVIIPLILLNGILLYRQQFLMLRRFEKLDMKTLAAAFIQQNLLLLAASGLLFGISALVSLPQIAVVLVLVAGITVYRLIWLRNI